VLSTLIVAIIALFGTATTTAVNMPGGNEANGGGDENAQVAVSAQVMNELATEMKRLKARVQEQDAWIKANTDAKSVVMMAGRRLERFRGRPEKTSDPSVSEWISD
jgi:hypothetical protein